MDSLQLTNLQLACSMTGAYFALNSRARGWSDEQVGVNRGAAKVAIAAFDVGSRWSFLHIGYVQSYCQADHNKCRYSE